MRVKRWSKEGGSERRGETEGGLGISASFVEFVFVGAGVNGLMCLRTLGPV